MSVKNQSIHSLKISSPCNVPWSSMKGTEKIRFCGQCGKNVHNLSAMTERQIRKIIKTSKKERICAGFKTNKDGTIKIGENSIMKISKKLSASFYRVGAYLSIILGFLGFGLNACSEAPSKTTECARQLEPKNLEPRNPASNDTVNINGQSNELTPETIEALGTLGYIEP